MDKLVILIVIFIIALVIEILIFKNIYPEQVDSDANQWKLWLAVGVTFVVLVVIGVYLDWSGVEMEYGFFSKKDKKVAPKKVPAPGLDRNPGGNPMKKPTYKVIKDDEPVNADKIYGGAAAASDINRAPLSKRRK